MATGQRGKSLTTDHGDRWATDERAVASRLDESREALQDLLTQLVDADAILGTDTAHRGSLVALDQIWLRVHAVEHRATALGLDRLAGVAARVHVLFSVVRQTGRAPSEEMLATIQRGLAVMTVLVLDLERRLEGHVPAALDEAVQSLFEQLNRLAAQERRVA